mmetsp:Transcript_1863/g.3995  ORF Transcript_1863/g.3995 Transcript_1863/m.3995 type:complete len:254 (-) Transcript_1863:1472-2233(-)
MEVPPSSNEAPITLEPIHQSVERVQSAVTIMAFAQVVLIVFFSEAACLYRRVCFTTEDIDIPPYMSFMYMPALFVAFVLSYFSYEASNYVLRGSVNALKIIDIIWGLLIIGGGVAALIAGIAQVEEDELKETWNKLTPFAQEYYDDDQDKLVEDFRINISLVCLTQIITGVILLAIGATLFILSSKAPEKYLPRTRADKKPQPAILPSQPLQPLSADAPRQPDGIEMRRLPPRREAQEEVVFGPQLPPDYQSQ